VPEIRVLIAKLLLHNPLSRSFVLAWSDWRRRHQICAAHTHYKRQQMQL
jgi:hypothetical protein